MQLLPAARSGVPERTGAEIVRDPEMRGAALQALRHAIDLDRSAVRMEDRGNSGGARAGGRAHDAAEESAAGESASAGVHTAAGISGRDCGVRGFVEGRDQLPEPKPVCGGEPGGDCGAVHAGERGDIRADPDRFLAADCGGGIVPAWGGLYTVAD